MTKNPNLGFTLIETLVAISILLLSIGGPIYAVSSAVGSAIYARDQITAFYLAQDAIEYIRNLRDQNALAGGDWTAFSGTLSNCTGNDCKVDTTAASVSFTPCSGGCPALAYDPSTGFYGYSSGSASPFTRSIRIANLGSPSHEMRIQVTIAWQTGLSGSVKTFTVTENLFNWE